MTATCQAVRRTNDGWIRCAQPAVAFIEDLEFGENFAVCAEHVTTPRTEIPGQLDIFAGPTDDEEDEG